MRLCVTLSLSLLAADCAAGGFHRESGITFTPEELMLAAAARAPVLEEIRTRSGKRPRNCTSDMRPQLPACKQATPFWCWATGISDLHFYYTSDSNRTCKSVECDVVSHQLQKDCCSQAGGRCYFDTADVKTITAMAKQYLQCDALVTHAGPPSEDELITLLEQRVPIMVLFQNKAGGGHVELLGGCDPHPPYPMAGSSNSYFIHDPMTDYWMNKTYADLVDGYHIQPPWAYSVYVPAESHCFS